MDIAEYLNGDPERTRAVARLSGIPVVRLRRIAADRGQAVRYMTARRLSAATGGVVTMGALALRGAMRGEETYRGPLGQAIADAASIGPDVAARLATAGLSEEHLHETLLRGRIPSAARMALYRDAFGATITAALFHRHAAWRRERPSSDERDVRAGGATA